MDRRLVVREGSAGPADRLSGACQAVATVLDEQEDDEDRLVIWVIVQLPFVSAG
jgi:hypothetical protein